MAPSPTSRAFEQARARVLMYHGFSVGEADSGGAARGRSYTLSLAAFESHLEAIEGALRAAPTTCWEPECGTQRGRCWAITFDDGLGSALAAADLLESRGWFGHFFIVSDWLDTPGFMTGGELLDLHRRGHIVGSHSASHPDPMSSLSYPRLLRQWRSSAEILGEKLGVPVKVASVPGGSLSGAVVSAAAESGIEVLFTSEPVSRIRHTEGCVVIGRHAVQSRHAASTVAAVAADRTLACAAQWAGWNTRKVAKRALGRSYYSLRARILGAPRRAQN